MSYDEPQLLKVYDPLTGATNCQNSSGALPPLTLLVAPVVDPVNVPWHATVP